MFYLFIQCLFTFLDDSSWRDSSCGWIHFLSMASCTSNIEILWLSEIFFMPIASRENYLKALWRCKSAIWLFTWVIFVLCSWAKTQHFKPWFSLSKLFVPSGLMQTLCSQRRREMEGQTVCDNSSSPLLALDMGLYTEERMSTVAKSIGQRGKEAAWPWLFN